MRIRPAGAGVPWGKLVTAGLGSKRPVEYCQGQEVMPGHRIGPNVRPPAVLKLEQASESPGGLVKGQTPSTTFRVSDSVKKLGLATPSIMSFQGSHVARWLCLGTALRKSQKSWVGRKQSGVFSPKSLEISFAKGPDHSCAQRS